MISKDLQRKALGEKMGITDFERYAEPASAIEFLGLPKDSSDSKEAEPAKRPDAPQSKAA